MFWNLQLLARFIRAFRCRIERDSHRPSNTITVLSRCRAGRFSSRDFGHNRM